MIREMQAYYARRAGVYDQSMGYDNPETVALLQPVIDFLKNETKDREIFEVACGTGFWTEKISETARRIFARWVEIQCN